MTVARTAAVAVAYYVAARLSLELALVGENVTPLWPPTGIAVVALLRYGRGLWPGILAGAFAVNVAIEPPVAAAATAAGNTLAPAFAVVLLARVRFRPELDRERDALALVFLGALVAMTVSATVGTTALVATEEIAAGEIPATWAVWWAGDAMGVLVVAPFLLCLPRFRDLLRTRGARRIEVLLVLVVVAVAAALVTSTAMHLLFALLPFLGWTAWRFQQPGAAPAALIVSLFAAWATSTGTGPFGGPLLERMLTFQAFNASVAITSFFFAALVSERVRARRELEEAATQLEVRVRSRTRELSAANRRLAAEVAERIDAESRLARSQRALAEAQELATVGSWQWDIASGEVHWSDELYRIHGHEPGSFAVTFDSAIAQTLPEDAERIRRNVERSIERGVKELPDVEYRIVRSDGETRVLLGRGRLSYAGDGTAVGMLGTVQDVTRAHEYEREHQISETLQQALLLKELPQIRGLELAARYEAAEPNALAGGDWYDVFALPDGATALVIGDVTGHGVPAASVMGQVRMALRAYALEGLSPAEVVNRTGALLEHSVGGQMVTLLYLVVDAASNRIILVNAGHPPPIAAPPGARAQYLETEANVPLGLGLALPYREVSIELEVGSFLLLYTDGLVDRHDLPVEVGLDRLREAATPRPGEGLDAVCDRVLALLPADASDDAAILGVRLNAAAPRLEMRIDARPSDLAAIRSDVREWLSASRVADEDADDIVLACSEAVANAIEHGYRGRGGRVEIDGDVSGPDLELVIRDFGAWKPPETTERGRGLDVIRACVDDARIGGGPGGSVIRLRRHARRQPVG